MSRTVLTSLALGAALIVATTASAESRNSDKAPPAAVSASRYAVQASYVSDGHGYTRKTRHMTDCLATYPSYDPRIDRLRGPDGSVRRCYL